MNANGIVYHAFDATNGKAYVGQTWKTLEKRRCEHLKSSTKKPFQSALRKRQNEFVWSVLTEVSSQEELDAAELYLGEFFDCIHPNGYCLKLGMGRGRVSEDTKVRMSLAQRNRSDETREKLSISLIGNRNGKSNKGRKCTPEQKTLIAQRTSEAVKRWWAARKEE